MRVRNTRVWVDRVFLKCGYWELNILRYRLQVNLISSDCPVYFRERRIVALTYVTNTARRFFHYSYHGYFILDFCARARDLGILITLPWHGHIHQVSNKIHQALRYLKFNKDLLSKQVHDTLISLVHRCLPPPIFSWLSRCIKVLQPRGMQRCAAIFVALISSISPINFHLYRSEVYDRIIIAPPVSRDNRTKSSCTGEWSGFHLF